MERARVVALFRSRLDNDLAPKSKSFRASTTDAATRARREHWNTHMEERLEAELPEHFKRAFVSRARDYHVDGRHLTEKS